MQQLPEGGVATVLCVRDVVNELRTPFNRAQRIDPLGTQPLPLFKGKTAGREWPRVAAARLASDAKSATGATATAAWTARLEELTNT